MTQIKVFYGRDADCKETYKRVNEWLSKNDKYIRVLDIKHSSCCTPDPNYYHECDTIMIIFEVDGGLKE